MCSNACFGHIIHFFGTYLYLNIHAIGTKQHGVQGLVTIGLGDSDIVSKCARKIDPYAFGFLAEVASTRETVAAMAAHDMALSTHKLAFCEPSDVDTKSRDMA